MKTAKIVFIAFAILAQFPLWGSENNTKTTPATTEARKPKATATNHTNAKKTEKVFVYQNPKAKYLMIQSLQRYDILLSDFDGKILKKASNTNYLSIADVKNGMYIVDYIDANGTKNNQIVTIINK